MHAHNKHETSFPTSCLIYTEYNTNGKLLQYAAEHRLSGQLAVFNMFIYLIQLSV